MAYENQRFQWGDLPAALQGAVEAKLQAPVVSHTARVGGYSAGMATVITDADGRATFIKAIPADNVMAENYRLEAKNVQLLPVEIPAPKLRFEFERHGWVVIAFDAVDGETLRPDMTQAQAALVVEAIAQFQQHLMPSPIPGLRHFADVFTFDVWRRLQRGGSAGPLSVELLPAGFAAHIDTLASSESHVHDAVLGEALLHLDIRHDNIVEDAKQLWFVDWSWPALGAPLVDVVGFLATCERPGLDREALLRQYEAYFPAPQADVDAFLVGLMGYWFEHAQHAAPENAPHLRPYQAQCAVRTAGWLQQRGWDLSSPPA